MKKRQTLFNNWDLHQCFVTTVNNRIQILKNLSGTIVPRYHTSIEMEKCPCTMSQPINTQPPSPDDTSTHSFSAVSLPFVDSPLQGQTALSDSFSFLKFFHHVCFLPLLQVLASHTAIWLKISFSQSLVKKHKVTQSFLWFEDAKLSK